MNIKLVEIAKTKAAVLLFIIAGCTITAMITYYHVVTRLRSNSVMKLRVVQSSSPAHEQQRRRHLQAACLASNDSWSDAGPGRLIVNHDLRLIFCLVGQVAGTSWLRMLLQLTGNPAAQSLAATDRSSIHGMFKYYLDLLSLQDPTQLASSPLKDYFKFMFVREPLERLFSSYRDKMFRAGYYVSLRKNIISQFRHNPSPRSLATGDDVRFEEFVQHVLQEARQGEQHLDTHWRPQYNLCQPCLFHYDFVGHYETLHQDAEHVLRQISRLTNNTDVKFPATDFNNRNRNTREFSWKFYEEISTKNLSFLLKLYEKDYEVFGYNISDIVRRKLKI